MQDKRRVFLALLTLCLYLGLAPACQVLFESPYILPPPEKLGAEEADGAAAPEPQPKKPPVAATVEDLEKLPVTAALIEQGGSIYFRACATCHGYRGDGNGPSAQALDPKPRDFTKGAFKWRSTTSGLLPRDRDLFRTVTNGVTGTRMVAWGPLLSARERWAVVQYIKTFSPRFEDEYEVPAEEDIVAVSADPGSTPESVARGGVLYKEFQCAKCHGERGRGDGPSAPYLQDDWKRKIVPFDFTSGLYRCGRTPEDLYRTFSTGINGTPMPSFADVISEEDRWPLVHHVRSLAAEPSIFEFFFGTGSAHPRLMFGYEPPASATPAPSEGEPEAVEPEDGGPQKSEEEDDG